MSAYYALYKLNEHSINYPVVPVEGSSGSEADFKNAKDAVWSMIQNGSASGNYFEENVPLIYDTSNSPILRLQGGSVQSTKPFIYRRAGGFIRGFRIHNESDGLFPS